LAFASLSDFLFLFVFFAEGCSSATSRSSALLVASSLSSRAAGGLQLGFRARPGMAALMLRCHWGVAHFWAWLLGP